VGKQAIKGSGRTIPRWNWWVAWSIIPTKVGKDAGEIAGIGKIGILCTGSFQDILAMEAECRRLYGLVAPISTSSARCSNPAKHVLLSGGACCFPGLSG